MDDALKAKIAAAKARLLAKTAPQGPQTAEVVTPKEPKDDSNKPAATPAENVEHRTVVVSADLQPTALVVVERPAAEEELPTSQRDVSRVAEPAAETNLDLNNPVHSTFLQRLADVQAALLERDPMMATHLREIHKMMISYEEIAALLTVEEISKILECQQVHTNTVLRQDVVKKSKASASRKVANVGLSDL